MATFERERKHGLIKGVYVGSRVFVPYLALEEYVRQLCEEQGVTFDDHTLATHWIGRQIGDHMAQLAGAITAITDAFI